MKPSQQKPAEPELDVSESTMIADADIEPAEPTMAMPLDAPQSTDYGKTHVPALTPPPAHDTGNPSNKTPWAHSQPSAAAGDGVPKPGTRINQYELIRELGKGGMGSVFLARDMRLGRKVAIKFLHTNNPEMARRFVQEARTTAQVAHDNIVIIYEVGEFGPSPYMVLEFLQGDPLHKLLRKGEKLPVARAIELMVPVVRALVTAHEQGVVHRDLKPENIMITSTGAIKVLDFGIAKVVNREGESLGAAKEAKAQGGAVQAQITRQVKAAATGDDTESTKHGVLMGTLAFMAPEQWRAAMGDTIDHRADLWAVGIMLFRMLAGKHPLDPLVGEQLFVVGVLDEAMPKLKDVAPEVPAQLAAAIDRCLEKRKDKRFPDAVSLLRALEPFLPGRYNAAQEIAENQSPYTGLQAFQEADANRFFGRSREIAAIVHKIADRPLIGVVGTSGAGKSSFIRAGLVPALKRAGENWETIVVRPGRSPLAALANVVAPLLTETTNSVADDASAIKKLIQKLQTEPGYVGTVLRSRARREKKKILLFVDQFEELYTLVPDPSDRLSFTQCLTGIADDATGPTRVVLSVRADFLDRASEDQEFMAELSNGLFFLNAPDRTGMRDALVQPAEMVGYKFETPQMVDHMLEHLESVPGALPLLQFAATQLWEMRDPARKLLTHESYERIGGIAGALASHADSVISSLPTQHQALARSIFLRLITPERTRAIVSMDELRELSRDQKEVQRLIDQLVQARLLVVQTGGGSGGSVEIVHESLVSGWPTLKRWLDEGQEDFAFLEQLRNAAKQWAQKGKSSDLLWRGDVVEEALRFKKRYRGELTETQTEFLDSTFALKRRGARVKRMLAVGAVTFGLVLLTAAAIALVVINGARNQAAIAAEEAKRNEAVAQKAKGEAELRLIEVQEKEKARAEAARLAEQANRELQKKQQDLISALENAERQRLLALRLKKKSDVSARAALLAEGKALSAAKEIQSMLVKEKERAKRLESQLGSPMIETLE